MGRDVCGDGEIGKQSESFAEIKEFVAVGEIKQQRADSVQADLRASSRTDFRAWPLGRFFAGLILRNCYVRIDNPKLTLQPPRGGVCTDYTSSDALTLRLAPWRMVSTHTVCSSSSTS